MPFVVGLRGTDPARAEEIERLTLDTLASIARQGLAPDLVEAAFHQVEFHGLEITRNPMPFPFMLVIRCLGSWLHDEDALPPLRFPTLINSLREQWTAGSRIFESAIQRWLIENPHRLRAVFAPSRTLAAEREERLRTKLAARRTAMSEQELEEVRRTAAALLEAQRAVESPEALATLPKLRLEDVPPEVDVIPIEVTRAGTRPAARSAAAPDGTEVLEHDLFSNGIAYLDVAFDVSDVPEDLQPFLPLLGEASVGMGAAGLDYAEFATRKALFSGDVSAELRVRDRVAGGDPAQVLILRARALGRNAGAMVGLIRDIATSGDLDDAGRLKDIVAEEKNHLRAEVAPAGYAFVLRTAAAGLSVAGRREEQWHGLQQLRFLGDLARSYETEGGRLRENLRRLRSIVIRRGRATINLTGDSRCLAALRGPAAELVAALPAGGEPGPASRPALRRTAWGVAIPGDVCYVGRVIPAPRQNDPKAPSVMILSRFLSDGFLYKKIRVEGGAYGGFCLYSPSAGTFGLASYRDPNLEKTLEIYDACLGSVRAEDLDAEKVRTAIIGMIGLLDRPMDAATRGITSLERHLIGLTDADRQRFRESLLAVEPRAVCAAATEILRPSEREALQAVYGPRERIEAANRTIMPPFEIVGLE